MKRLGRREFLGAIGVLGSMILGGTAAAAPAKELFTAYLGSFSTWGKPRGRGLEIGTIDGASGQLTIIGAVTGVPDASFLAFSPDRRRIYAVSELKPEGRVTALDIGGDPRRLSVLNSQPTGGAGPTRLSVHPSGRYLLTANYNDGTVIVHPLLPDGRIGTATDMVRHAGETRSARTHQVVSDPSGQWVVAVDLGADSVYVYGFDLALGKLRLHQQLKLAVGAGPRHLAFHPDGRTAYILGEPRSEITVAAWDAGAGHFAPGQVIGTLGDATPQKNFPAEIQLSPDGRFVYASNRGHDSIAMFSTEASGEELRFGGTAPTAGLAKTLHPRPVRTVALCRQSEFQRRDLVAARPRHRQGRRCCRLHEGEQCGNCVGEVGGPASAASGRNPLASTTSLRGSSFFAKGGAFRCPKKDVDHEEASLVHSRRRHRGP